MKPVKSKTRKPIQDRSIETKEKIVQSAYKLVKRNGYSETGIRDIVETAEVSIGTFYSYFRDKNDIALEILRKYSEEFYGNLALETVAAIGKNVGLAEVVYQILNRMLVAAQKNPNLHREWIVLSLTDDKIAKAVKTIEGERIQTEAAGIFNHFAGKIKFRSEPIALTIAQRAMDDIISYMVLQGFDLKNEIVLRETAKMIASYLSEN
ncbi:TetR/AcrR family transcriptional regulator [Leptospira kmetyi]|uniref:TetR/AcrR family transcriptional regulator n=1 Tax=Leptospira kmetyi TaxID=408139 RepID=A0AAD0XMM8_9LEPT|nr:TetR/AcrR family transcriptional regulator [Leptospira kmetyi]AYV54489.1 TetR/AcrR family transcriptional regulator [Leptospira kmetyi]